MQNIFVYLKKYIVLFLFLLCFGYMLSLYTVIDGLGAAVTNYAVYTRAASLLIFLIPLVALLYLCVSGTIRLVRIRKKVVRFALLAIALAILIAAFFPVFGVEPSLPADLIPNQWSNFAFWGEKLTACRDSVRYLLLENKTTEELAYAKPLMCLVAYTAIGLVLFVLSLLLWSRENLWRELIAACVVELVVILVLYRHGVVLDYGRFLLYLWPYVLAGRCVVAL